MRHLTVDEIIQFVSLTEMNEDAVHICATVNSHICKCGECLRQVQAFQTIYDAFARLHGGENFAQYVYRAAEQAAAEGENAHAVRETQDHLR